MRAKVEHPLRVLKQILSSEKVFDRDLVKTTIGCALASHSSTLTCTAENWADARRSVPKKSSSYPCRPHIKSRNYDSNRGTHESSPDAS